jgi:hypothetical protein
MNICRVCFKELPKCKAGYFATIYCSTECEKWGKQNLPKRNRVKRERENTTNAQCTFCGGLFNTRSINIKRGWGKYCSIICRDKHQKKLKIGEDNPAWRGGISFEPYCPKFNNEFKERVRIFFGRKCAECGKTEEENGRKLSIHHINYDKQICCNGKIPLFIALCHAHNTKANKNREDWELHYTNIINTKYNRKCYLTKEEYALLPP